MSLDLTGLGSVADLAKSLVNRFLPPSATEAEKLTAQVQTEQLLQNRENAILDTQKTVMTAELSQGDKYTKRARPSIVYFGLVAIGLVHVVFPILVWLIILITNQTGITPPEIELPAEFWYTWGGVCSVWVIGRSAERHGSSNPVVKFITGSK